MVKVCWDPWGRWNTGECTCSMLASAEGPPPCLGALITLIAFSLGPQPSNLTKSLHWWNWAENISNILVPAVHLLVLFVHLMKRCWSPHLLVTISLVSTCILDNNWKVESIFFDLPGLLSSSPVPQASQVRPKQTPMMRVVWGRNLSFSNDLVKNWTRRDGDEVLCVWPCILVWEAYAPCWVESQPVKTQSKLVSWAWGCLVVSRHPWDVIQNRCLACKESLGLPFQPHSLRICPNQIFLPDDEDGDGPPPSPSSDGWWWWGWWWWWWCHFWWWWTEISKVVYNMLFQHVISQQI